MLRQIRLLSKIQLLNLFEINEVRYTKDQGRRMRFLGLSIIWLMLIAMCVFYVVMSAYGYIMLGIAEIIPAYLYMATSMIILAFTFFKAGNIIFQMKSYEMMVSLPVSKAAIVVSRFFTMYVTNLLLSILVIVPGLTVYAVFEQPPIFSYVYALAGIFLLPLFPVVIATAVSAGIMALTARMKHKSIFSALFMILVVLAVMAGSILMSGEENMISQEMMKNLAAMFNQMISRTYPPAIWFQNTVIQGEVVSFIGMLLLSLGVFLPLIALLQKYFLTVCTALNASMAKNNYKMQSLHSSSIVKALWKKEWKRYFASSIYVTNTIVGYMLMVFLAAAVLLGGKEKIETILEIPGITGRFLPMILAFLAVFMPITSCSISMEGKQRWRMQTLPIRSRDIWNGKILLQLSVAFPFYCIAVLLSILALTPSLLDILWLVIIPAAYILFSSVAGITVNLAMPIFNWENETRVVKQSASVLVTMLVGLLSVIPTCVSLEIFPKEWKNGIYLVTVAAVVVVTFLLYQRNAERKL